MKMTRLEKSAVLNLSMIMALRMLGLFMVVPLFSLYATHLTDATPALIGIAMSIYGLSQAIFQIPMGALSDRFGRKPIIAAGLLLFLFGSLMAGQAHSIYTMMIGRALQGLGAIGSTILALLADLTRDDQRTKSMAIAGMTIGASFCLALLLGPILIRWFSMPALFNFAALFAFFALIILFFKIPKPEQFVKLQSLDIKTLRLLLLMPKLARLNLGIFILHAIFTATFIVLPLSLSNQLHFSAYQQWVVYVPSLLLGFIVSLISIGIAERFHKIGFFFNVSILLLFFAEIFLWCGSNHIIFTTFALFLFFSGFSLLEAFLPSLVSRLSPATLKGTALGLYSFSQFFGIFAGGTIGGWLLGAYGQTSVFMFCMALAFLWFFVTDQVLQPTSSSPQDVALNTNNHSNCF